MKKILSCFIILMSFTALQAQYYEWRYMNSRITAFATIPGSPNTIIAGDVAGLIRKSTDAGKTWQLLSMISEFRINHIQFLDANTGFATTSETTALLKTEDGGQTWRKIIIRDEKDPYNMYRFQQAQRIVMVDNQTVYFDIYNHPISAPSSNESIVSRDGGKTFIIDTAPGELFHVAGDTMLAFGRVKGNFNLAKFGTFISYDQGKSWDTVQIEPTGLGNNFNNNGMNLAHFLSAKEFFITAEANMSGDAAIYYTADTGHTFQALTVPTGISNGKPSYIHFKNRQEGIVIFSASLSSAFYTTDGGQSWKNVQGVQAQGQGIYLGNNTFISHRGDATITFSDDYGKSWTALSDQVNTISGSGSASFGNLQLVDDKVAYASLGRLASGVFSGRVLMRTEDGGMSWHKVRQKNGDSIVAQSFYAISKDTFYFSTTNHIEMSTDGGKTVKRAYDYPNFNVNYLKEYLPVGKNGLLAYGYSHLMYSADRGKTWTQKLFNPFSDVLSMAVASENHWFAVGSDKKLYHTTDGGQNWQELSSKIKSDIGRIFDARWVYFQDKDTGYAYGDNYLMLKTTDAGNSWQNISANFSSQSAYNQNTGMVFRNPQTAYLYAGSENYPLTKTTNAGQSFNRFLGAQYSAGVIDMHVEDTATAGLLTRDGMYSAYTGYANIQADTLLIDTVKKQVVHIKNTLQSTPPKIFYDAGSKNVIIHAEKPINQAVVTDMSGRILLIYNPGTTQKLKDVNLLLPSTAKGIVIISVQVPQGWHSQKIAVP